MMKKVDNVRNWFDLIPKEFKPDSAKDPTYSKHLIKPNSMIVVIGQTGSGKTNSVVEYLARSSGTFYDITIFTGSSKHEPLYDFLASKIDGLTLTDDVAELPSIDDYKDSDDRNLRKLVIFDDSIMEDKKILKQIEKFYMAGRKAGFTCIFLSQNYSSTPIFIRRNAHYLWLFKLTDMRDAKTILSKHAMDIDINTLKNMLLYATKAKGNFLNIACNADINEKYRKNFTEILNPVDFA